MVFLSIFCHFLKIVPDLYEAVGMIRDEEEELVPQGCPDPTKVGREKSI